MKLTERLVHYLHRVFDKNPERFLALRIGCDGTGLTWTICDAVLTVEPVGGSASPMTIDLRSHTVAALAAFIAAQPGYAVLYVDGSSRSALSSLALMDGAGDVVQAGGDCLYGYTSVVWAYIDANAEQLTEAGAQIGNMLQQMNTVTAEGCWLDMLGSYYGIFRKLGEPDAQYGPRIVATVVRPLGNNVAIESALRVLNGGLAASVADVDLPLNNGYGLFDVDFAVSPTMLQAATLLGWQAAITDVIDSMRDAGTHMRRLDIVVPVEATPHLGALVRYGQTVWIAPS